jgi:hypothetical protein
MNGMQGGVWMRLPVLLMCLAVAMPAQSPVAKSPVVTQGKPEMDAMLRAMIAELERARSLRIVSLDLPYYIAYSVDDAEMFSASASLGGLTVSRRVRTRIPKVEVRVGGYAFDNTNHVFSNFYTGARYDSDLPLDDDVMALRHQFWLATDRAYKTALEAIARKRATLRNVTITEKIPDFSQAEPAQVFIPLKRSSVDERVWTTRLRQLSALFGRYPEVTMSGLEVSLTESASYFLSSEGSAYRIPERLAYVAVRATGLAPDGMRVRDGVTYATIEPERMVSEAEMRAGVERVAANVVALTKAPLGESYSGPVLFEPFAAAQLFAEVLGANLSVTRRPISDPSRPVPILLSELEGRFGSRVLPEFLDVMDDPTQKEWRGRALAGHYSIDLEGVIPKPINVIEKGVLKALLTTRQPVKGIELSNGRARLPGNFGAKTAIFSNLLVQASETSSLDALKKRLLEMCSMRGKAYGVIVRSLDYPSSAPRDEIRSHTAAMQSGGSARPVSLPALVYRIYPDGREELVRGLRFRGMTMRSLKDIIAASQEMQAFDFLNSGAPLGLSAGGYVTTCSVVAPGVLFEDLELERREENLEKPPVVPPPPLAAIPRS